MKELKAFGWYWYTIDETPDLDEDKCGKWMYFFSDQEKARDICKKAINDSVCLECKCTDMDITGTPTGVICFYLNGDDIDGHKKVINFMINNNLIRKTKTGKYYNNSFKFDNQTKAGEYGGDFKGEIKLEQFIDLNTGEWKWN